MVMFVAAPIVATNGYIRSTRAPASQTGTGTPGTFDAVTSLACAAAATISDGMRRESSPSSLVNSTAGSLRAVFTNAAMSVINLLESSVLTGISNRAIVTAFSIESPALRVLMGMFTLSVSTGAPFLSW